jgi:Rrf2 family protein
MPLGSSVEYGLHALLQLAVMPANAQPSAADLAAFQKVPPELLAKVFTRLQKAGLVVAREGVGGGYRLARAAADITVLDAVDAIEGRKPVFRCRNIRLRCAVFDGKAPAWAARGLCGIHALMIEAEDSLRARLAARTLADLADGLKTKAPEAFVQRADAWFAERARNRSAGASRPGRRPSTPRQKTGRKT